MANISRWAAAHEHAKEKAALFSRDIDAEARQASAAAMLAKLMSPEARYQWACTLPAHIVLNPSLYAAAMEAKITEMTAALDAGYQDWREEIDDTRKELYS